jgi:hypothetical protein
VRATSPSTGPQYFGGFLNNNEGTTTLNSGAANTILVAPTAAAVTTIALTANAGTVDLNGQNQAFAAIASINNPLPGTGSLITSATAGDPNLHSAAATSAVSSAVRSP